MTINDRVYGKIAIPRGIFEDLINSSPVQRLKKVDQSGADKIYDPTRDVTRFEHSVGVWYILKKYNASVEEQIAGLLHDTPHTAFAHVADYAFQNEGHKFHEKFTEKVILESEIPTILKKHKIKLEKIFDKSKFHLLESELPDLSADRIDYFLRDTRKWQLFPDSLVKEFLRGIFVRKSTFYFKSASLATLYSILFMNAGRLLWLSPSSVGAYHLLALAIKRSIALNEMTMENFFGTDEQVLRLLKNSKDLVIKKYLTALKSSRKFAFVDEAQGEYTGPNKPRIVDPPVLVKGQMKRVTILVPELERMFNEYKSTYKVTSVAQIK